MQLYCHFARVSSAFRDAALRETLVDKRRRHCGTYRRLLLLPVASLARDFQFISRETRLTRSLSQPALGPEGRTITRDFCEANFVPPFSVFPRCLYNTHDRFDNNRHRTTHISSPRHVPVRSKISTESCLCNLDVVLMVITSSFRTHFASRYNATE
jgi:hypothetical protein